MRLLFVSLSNQTQKTMAKKLLSWVFLLCCSVAWTLGANPTITLRTAATGSLSLTVVPAGGSTVTIDWGNGTQVPGSPNWSGTTYTFSGSAAGERITLHGAVTELNVSSSSYGTQNGFTSIEFVEQSAMQKFEAQNNELTSIDLSGCTALTDVNLTKNKLTQLDVSALSKLEYLLAPENELVGIILGEHPALRELKLGGNNLSALNLPNALPTLRVLDLENNALLSLDLAKTPQLRTLNINGNGFTTLDLQGLTMLDKLFAQRNYLLTIDVSKNTFLTNLDLSNNLISAIDVSANTDLTLLDMSGNKLSRIDVRRLSRLQTLGVSKNEAITHLNLSRNTYLRTLKADTTAISGLDVSASARIDRIYIRGTRVDACALNALFAGLPDFSQSPKYYTNIHLSHTAWRGADFDMLSERGWKHDIAADADHGTKVSCANAQVTLEASTGGEAALMYGSDELTLPATYAVGSVIHIKATPEEGYELGAIAAEVREADGTTIRLPLTDLGLTLTGDTKVVVTFRPVETRELSLTTSASIGADFELSLRQVEDSDRDHVLVDWGNGVWTEQQVTRDQTTTTVLSGKLAGQTVRVRGAITRLAATEQSITAVDLGRMPTLTYVDLYFNELTSIDLSALTRLDILNLAYNELTSIDLTHNTALRSLSIYGNSDITTLNLEHNKALVELNAKGLNLTTLSLDLPQLEELDVQNNKLTQLDLSRLPKLIVLRIAYNQFGVFAPTTNLPELKLLVAGHAGITHLDTRRMPMLEQLYLSDNPLRELILTDGLLSLNYVDISDCGLDACALDKIYQDMPTWATSTVDATFPVTLYNRGQSARANAATTSKTSIVTAKGWSVAAQGDGSGCKAGAVEDLAPGSGFGYYSHGEDFVVVLAPDRAEGMVRLIDLSGQTIYTGQGMAEHRLSLPRGSYLLVIDGKSFKVMH